MSYVDCEPGTPRAQVLAQVGSPPVKPLAEVVAMTPKVPRPARESGAEQEVEPWAKEGETSRAAIPVARMAL